METFSNMFLLMPPSWLVRVAVALLWLYEGVWCKVLDRAPRQAQAIGTVGASEGTSTLLFKLLGWVELVLALWVLSNFAPGWCAVVQSTLLIVLTSGALIFARNVIHDPAGVVFKNIVFITLIWVQPGLAALHG
jgi:uncharacterized membrane protein YphA (DoxX/SURF4 family)